MADFTNIFIENNLPKGLSKEKQKELFIRYKNGDLEARDLLIGVNIGGTGTLIASLASLITFKEYTKQDPGHTLRYIIKFTLFNFAFLIILILVCLAFGI